MRTLSLSHLLIVAGYLLILLVLSFILLGCQPDPAVSIATNTPLPPAVAISTNTPLPTETPSPTASLTPSATPVTPSNTPSPTSTFTPSSTPTPTFTASPTFTRTPYPTKAPGVTYTPMPAFAPLNALPPSHLWFERPIGEDAINYVERTYTYGNTQNGTYPPHHGVEFYNPVGTPILTVADGIVVFAGPDLAGAALSPQPNFYGNVVVIEHSQPINNQPLFTLYGHLSVVAVEPGQAVRAGDLLGKVGGTGVAQGGPHLHFEVRVGYNDYYSTRNPELWLKPFPRWGTLAGRVVDQNGDLVPLAAVVIRAEKVEGDAFVSRYLTTYAAETVNPDPAYGENFVVMDLPPGTYTVQVGTTKTYKQTAVVKPDQITWVEFRDVTPPPTWTVTPTGTRETPTASATATPTEAETPSATETPKP